MKTRFESPRELSWVWFAAGALLLPAFAAAGIALGAVHFFNKWR